MLKTAHPDDDSEPEFVEPIVTDQEENSLRHTPLRAAKLAKGNQNNVSSTMTQQIGYTSYRRKLGKHPRE
jgi:hypothetical protein